MEGWLWAGSLVAMLSPLSLSSDEAAVGEAGVSPAALPALGH